ncbi:hypothetical protein BD779DRAFT_534764 [Infundibulicybe gibba]|nr:hypothetical protein BD779DRAFT_534764 [Infundibulicybe gibba]
MVLLQFYPSPTRLIADTVAFTIAAHVLGASSASRHSFFTHRLCVRNWRLRNSRAPCSPPSAPCSAVPLIFWLLLEGLAGYSRVQPQLDKEGRLSNVRVGWQTIWGWQQMNRAGDFQPATQAERDATPRSSGSRTLSIPVSFPSTHGAPSSVGSPVEYREPII